MHDIAERLVRDVEEGRLSRRDAVAGLVAVAAATFAGNPGATAAEGAPTFQSKGLNHIALNVKDLERCSAFYKEHLGLKVLQQGEHNAFLAAGGNNFVGLFRSERSGMNHYAFTIDDYDPGNVVDKLKGAGLKPERHEDRVYFDDAEGNTVQLTGEWNDYPRSD